MASSSDPGHRAVRCPPRSGGTGRAAGMRSVGPAWITAHGSLPLVFSSWRCPDLDRMLNGASPPRPSRRCQRSYKRYDRRAYGRWVQSQSIGVFPAYAVRVRGAWRHQVSSESAAHCLRRWAALSVSVEVRAARGGHVVAEPRLAYVDRVGRAGESRGQEMSHRAPGDRPRSRSR